MGAPLLTAKIFAKMRRALGISERDQQKWYPVLTDKRLRLSRDRAPNY
jgi:hypothetical protein